MKNKKWPIFQVYNFYRLCLIGIILIFQTTSNHSYAVNSDWAIYASASYLMLVVSMMVFYRNFSQESLIVFSGLCDLLFLNSFLFFNSLLIKGIGILLSVAIAAMAILLPGIISLFFAAFESILLLSLGYYLLTTNQSNTFLFYAAINGAGFFATALTSLSLANWIKKNKQIAAKRSKQIVSLQQLNAYLIQKLDSAIFIVNDDFSVIYINRAAQKLLNKPLKSPFDLKPVSAELYQLFRDGYLQQTADKMKTVCINQHECSVHFMAYKTEDKMLTVVLADDRAKMFEQANQLKLASLGRFTASIAHELRNPLGAISHANQILSSDNNQPKQNLRLLEIINNNCERMNHLIKNVLQLSRQEKSKRSIIEPKRFFDDFISSFGKREGLTINNQLTSKTENILFDKSQLNQLMVIFTENTLLHGKDSEGRATINIYQKDSHYDEICYICIEDQGKGIDSESAVNVFEPFYTTSRSGVGLGLFIAKELCDANGATLRIEKTGRYQGAGFEIGFKKQARQG